MTKTEYPKTVPAKDTAFTLRLPVAKDAEAVHAFACALPAHDLLYLRRDISKRPVVDAWLDSIEDGESIALLAEQDGALVGMSAIMMDRKSWSPHVGEIRVLIGEAARGKGLGRMMIQESFLQALDLGLEKIVAQMTLDQGGARAVFEEMGFQPEALLKNHVRDRNGEDHDILIMSCDVASASERMQAYR
ncbi:MAG: GNAT family N-acetyltransferase [Hyphomonas sp.]|nr:GNAT family N-acetyltransferase [Hyphomonas sp.]